MPSYTVKNKTTGEIFKTDIIRYTELEKMLASDKNLEMVLTAPKIVGMRGSVVSKTSDLYKDKLKEIKKKAGKDNTIKV